MTGPRKFLLGAIAIVIAVISFCSFQDIQESSQRGDDMISLREEADAAFRSGDPSAALRMAAAALREHPESASLHLLAARAYCGLGRFKDALQSCAKAEELDLDDGERAEAKFLTARAIAGRFIETGGNDDRKRAEADLSQWTSDPRFGAASKVLLGRMLSRKSSATEPADRAAAIRYLEAGLNDASAADWLSDLDDARRHLEALRSAEGTSGG